MRKKEFQYLKEFLEDNGHLNDSMANMPLSSTLILSYQKFFFTNRGQEFELQGCLKHSYIIFTHLKIMKLLMIVQLTLIYLYTMTQFHTKKHQEARWVQTENKEIQLMGEKNT